VSAAGFGLYIHVPFCGSICSYCHFARTARHAPADRAAFVDGVLAELELRLQACRVLREGRRRLLTAYLGGGTPSLLEPELMSRLLLGTVGRLARTEDLELTVEANPESLDEARAAAWRAAGVNRVSLGVQSLDAGVLDLLGRRCDPAVARRGLKLAVEHFSRVSADWIIGPGLTRDRLLAELAEAVDLGVAHFSLYILEVHPGPRLQQDLDGGKVRLPGDAHTENLYLAAGDFLAGRGIEQYEVANFARPGQESRHNQGYWQGRPWLGLGPAAHGFWGRRRYANRADLPRWRQDLQAGRLPEAESDPLDLQARRLERAILALRTVRGLPLAWIPPGALDLDRGARQGLWELRGGRLVLTRRGFLRIDGLEERLAAHI
jgi:putative oxygen-independent coproporphyrinogen III oxidase